MEVLKTFENLPETDKVRFFEALLADSKRSCEASPQASSPEKSNINTFFQNLKHFGENSPDYNTKVVDSKIRQKTLDSWLIKNDNRSSLDRKTESSSSPNTAEVNKISRSDISNVLETSCSAETVINNLDVEDSFNSSCNFSDKNRTISKYSRHASNPVIVNKSTHEKGSLSIAPEAVETSNLLNETYNLRSKRKLYHASPEAESNDKATKHYKNNLSNVNDCDKNSNCSLDNQDMNADSPQTICDRPNNDQSSEETDSLMNVSLRKKETYKLRTKKKNTRLKHLSQCNIIAQENLNDQTKDTEVISTGQLLQKNSSSLSNYEVFCKLSRKCSDLGLNIRNILQNENIQNLLNDHKNKYKDAIVFFGSSKSNDGKIFPVVHVAQSKRKLLKNLDKL